MASTFWCCTRILTFGLGVALALWCSSARAERVLVYPIKTGPALSDISETLTDIVAEQVASTSGHEVLTYEDLQGLVEAEALNQALGSDDAEALLRIGEKARADYIVKGTVAELGSALALTLTLLKTADASAQKRVQQTLYGDTAQVSASLRTASQALMSQVDGAAASSMSAKAFHRVYVGERPKTWNARVGAGGRTPTGSASSPRGVPYVRSPQVALVVDVGRMLFPSVEGGLSLSAGFGSAEPTLQGRLGIVDEGVDPIGGQPRTVSRFGSRFGSGCGRTNATGSRSF